MNTIESQNELTEKNLAGLTIVYERLIEFKKQMKSYLVIMKDDKIIKIKP